ncbi:MAG TPA: uracil-DNA glycosylase [Steroidobacteraceae bacterium]
MQRARKLAYLAELGVELYVPRAGARAEEPLRGRPAVQASDPSGGALSAPQTEPVLDWEPLRAAVAACTRCALHAGRTQTVFGVGDRSARWMIVGEAPGVEEDRRGEPFVGRAGQLLDSMLRALGPGREQVYIANVLKCRPPGNRDPRPEEARSCRSYLDRQIELVEPTVIIAVGRIAAQTLLDTDLPLGKLRGRVHALGERQWPVIVTYHPAYLLRSPGEKRKAWQDLLFARRIFGELEQARGPQ